jgi:hypothetical protein
VDKLWIKNKVFFQHSLCTGYEQYTQAFRVEKRLGNALKNKKLLELSTALLLLNNNSNLYISTFLLTGDVHEVKRWA